MWKPVIVTGHGVLAAKSLEAGTYWTDPIKLYDDIRTHAFQYKIASAGSGTLTVTPYTSISQQHWVSNGTKLSGAVKTSGPDSDGIDCIPLTLKPGEVIKFKIVVGVATSDITLEFVQK